MEVAPNTLLEIIATQKVENHLLATDLAKKDAIIKEFENKVSKASKDSTPKE